MRSTNQKQKVTQKGYKMVKLEDIKSKKLLHEFILQSLCEFIDDSYTQWKKQIEDGDDVNNAKSFFRYLKEQLNKEITTLKT